MKLRTFFEVALLVAISTVLANGQVEVCKNPNRKTYNRKPAFCAPEGTRGVGISLVIDGEKVSIPDLRCSCLPIALRYNNPGVLKTPRAGWKTQLRDSNGRAIADSKGHALFGSVEDGIAGWVEWMKRRSKRKRLKTAFQIMSLYAPPDDCVGSIGKPPNCPYGINPTLEYARQVASAVNKGPKEPLNLNGSTRAGRDSLYALFSAISTFEIGPDFCKARCEIDREVFEKAMDSIWGKVKN